MDIQRCLQEYLAYLAVERGCAHNTVEAYNRDLQRYVTYLVDAGITEPDAVTRTDVEQYLRLLGSFELASSSIERACSAIKGFHRFMVAEQLSSVHPTADIPLPKSPTACLMLFLLNKQAPFWTSLCAYAFCAARSLHARSALRLWPARFGVVWP